jgi:plasmid maintenance system antidote protein VapI
MPMTIRAALSRIVDGRSGISAEMAVRLEKAIGSTAGFWLRLQVNYDLAQIQAKTGKIHVRRLGTPAQFALCTCAVKMASVRTEITSA